MAWDIPDFTLKGQPGISEDWADGIASARKDKLVRNDAEALKLGRQQAVSSAYDADGRFDSVKATNSLMKIGDFDGAKAVSGFGGQAQPVRRAPPQAVNAPVTVPLPQPRPANLGAGPTPMNRTSSGLSWRVEE